jgi:hypothetical protein
MLANNNKKWNAQELSVVRSPIGRSYIVDKWSTFLMGLWPVSFLTASMPALQRTLFKKAGPQHERDGNFRHPHRSSGLIYVDDGFFRLFTWMTAFSITHMFWVCVTLSFCNSVYRLLSLMTAIGLLKC